ncbi:hypothetical protein A2U01_0101439, partial [Trifolium medium]|nr:hypothetical protein [Trifolium medium]
LPLKLLQWRRPCLCREEEDEVGEDDDVASSYWPLNLLLHAPQGLKHSRQI